MIGESVSHYRILRKVGEGGMGLVYEAEDARLGRRVALKFIHPGFVSDEKYQRRFLREARAASALNHPNICHVYDIGQGDDGRWFLAMALCDGETLKDRIARGPLEPQDAMTIAHEIASGLSAAHARDIIHRDIKPSNVMIGEDGTVQIVDFGLALIAESTRLTRTGDTWGTVPYMSPEQSNGESVDHRTDIFSLGAVLYEMVTGNVPFGRGRAALHRVRSEPHEPAKGLREDLPSECSGVIDRCLEKEVDRRYSSAREVAEDIVAVADSLEWPRSPSTVPAFGRGGSRWGLGVSRRAIVAVATVALIVVGAYLLERRTSPSLYTTPTRIAVMPLENKLLPEGTALAEGLTRIVSRIATAAALVEPSMWVVPHAYVTSADLPDPSHATKAFGVNRLITGDVQRFQTDTRVSLELVDAESLDVLTTASIVWRVDGQSAFVDALVSAMHELCEIGPASPWEELPSGPMLVPVVEGLGHLSRETDSESLDRAISSFDAVVRADSSSGIGRIGLAWGYWHKYRLTREDALAERAERVLVARPESELGPWALSLAGELHRRMGDAERASVVLGNVVAASPRDIVTRRNLSRAYMSAGRFHEAESELLALTSEFPDCFVSHRMLGAFYYRRSRPDEATRAFTEASRLAPTDGYTINALGALHFQAGRWTDSRRYFEEAFALWPSCDPCSNLGLAHFYERHFERAAEYYELAFEYCGSQNFEMWGNLASALYWIDGRREEAIATYRRAIDLAQDQLDSSPHKAHVMSLIADYHSMVADTAQCRVWIERLEPFLAQDESVMFRVGAAYEMFGERGQALRYLEDSIRHGFPLTVMLAEPVLDDLVEDPRFRQFVASHREGEEAPTGESP